MTAAEFAVAHDLGYHYAEQAGHQASARGRDLDRDELRDAAHPEAFSEALDALPQCEAYDISVAVDAGITDAFETYA